ncbi:hypothetical protein ABZ388_06905 [Micromonospora parva]|uniref:hypothetical protein n=1 Tax=Micromonospora parva TaxID=1464048 RepID=UPI0033EDD504
MSLNTLPLAIAGALVTRRHKRNYQGKRREPRNAGPGYLLSPAAVQLVTRTHNAVHADVDQPTGLLAPRPIHPTGAWTQPTGVATDDEIQQWVTDGGDIDDQTTTTGEKDQ